MINLIRIETRRLLFTRINAALVVSTLCFAYYVLGNYTILGSVDTAPFSEWSFADYLSRVMPFLLVILLFFETYVFSRKERAVRSITLTTPISMREYLLVKTAAIYLAWLPAALLVIGLGLGFYAVVFQIFAFSHLWIPAVLFIVPPAIFVFGMGMMAGSIHNNLPYLLSITVFFSGITGFSFLPAGWSLFSSTWNKTYPLSLVASTTGDIPFHLPVDFLTARLVWALAGVILFVVVIWTMNHKKEGV